MMTIKRDRKGPCWILSHQRCGVTESMFLTDDEVDELLDLILGL